MIVILPIKSLGLNTGNKAIPIRILTSCFIMSIGFYLVSTTSLFALLPHTCIFKSLFSIPCPGCGGLGALCALCNGNIQLAWHYNAAITLLPFAIGAQCMLCLIWMIKPHNTYKYWQYINNINIAATTAIVVNWLYQLTQL